MFRKRKLSKSQVNFISRIYNIFARLAAGSLSARLRSSVQIRVASVKQMTYKSFIRLIPAPATLATINMGSLKGKALFEIDPVLTFSIIDRLCGGTGEAKAPHEFTDIETALVEGIIVHILGNMREAWGRETDLKPSLQQIDTNPMFVQIVNPADMVIIARLETVAGNAKGRMHICIPCVTAELLMERPSVENNKPANNEDVHADLAGEIKELKRDFLELKDDLISKISMEKASEQAQGQKIDAQEIDILEHLSAAAKNNVENVAELVRVYLEQEEYSKAAIFLVALGSELSIEIYKNLREDEIETLTFAISRLDRIDNKQKTAVLKEFHASLTANRNISIGGIDYAHTLLEGSLGGQKAVDIISRLTASLQVRPFDFVRRTDPVHLLNCIRQEHPQIIALVLAYLDPYKASTILQNLPRETQGDIARRIATMDRTSAEALREIERVLEKKLSTSCEDYIAAGGVESIVEILNMVDRSSEKQIIETLEKEDKELAEEIKKRMFVFEDIVMLDDRAVQKVLREVEACDLAKALKTVDLEIQDRIFLNMSKDAANMIKEDMEFMGPVLLKDVEAAQQKIISIIRNLEAAGEIVIARAGEEELVV